MTSRAHKVRGPTDSGLCSKAGRGQGAEILCLQQMKSGPRPTTKAEALCSGSERLLDPLALSQREVWSYKTTVAVGRARLGVKPPQEGQLGHWLLRGSSPVHVDGIRGLVSSRLSCAAHRFGMHPRIQYLTRFAIAG
jgi:hypothetical protein